MDLILGRLQKTSIIKKTDNKQIWLLNNTTSGEMYAGKFQSKSKLDKVNVKHVLHQASFIQMMQGHTGIPLMYWSGMEGLEIVVIIQYLGFTLQQRLEQCGGKFSIKSTCMIGVCVLNIVRNLHEKGLVHRNITPSCLQFGRGFKSLDLFINDLIDSKKFRNKKSYAHIPQKKGIKFTYQNCFASYRFHRNEQIGRIDDIQNIIKILIYFVTGVKPNNKGIYMEKQIPSFLKQMLNHCGKFQFADQPNYQWFVQKLQSTLFHNSHQNDRVFDWMVDKKRIERLRINKNVISLALDQDKDILAQLYDPYEQSIDIDEVSSKHNKFYGQNQAKNTQNLIQSKKSVQLQQKLRKRKTQHRQKTDCSLM